MAPAAASAAPAAGLTALERLAARQAAATTAPPLAGTGTRPPLRPAPTRIPPAPPAVSTTALRPAPAGAERRLPTPLDIENAVDHVAYERFAAGIRSLLGFDLTQYKRPQVWRRANSFARQKGCTDVDQLVERCRGDATLRTALRDMITINVSEFFRNPDAWESLRALVLPDLLRLGRPIRFWSAGCSLGYEPYTFAMLVREAGLPGADARITATDLDETILGQARASAYAEHQLVGVSVARRARFFESVEDRWVVRPELRSMITWRRHDLLRDPFPVDQDLIACRNVVIYFTDEAKDGLYRNFARSLRVGGFLFIGATEAIHAPREFGLQMVTSGIYRRTA
jgi:chemotaxis protein methyltransferase CheR